MSGTNMLKYKDYLGSIEYSVEDQVLHGKIECINDLVMYETTDATQLQHVFEEAVDDYIATCEEMGKEPDKVYSGNFNVRIDGNLHKRLHIEAKKQGVKLNKLIGVALQHYFEERSVIHHHHHHVSSESTKSHPILHVADWSFPEDNIFHLQNVGHH